MGGRSGDYVRNAFQRMAADSPRMYLAAPYFKQPEPLVHLARAGKAIQLLVGLNATTTPQALAAVLSVPNLSVRYLTSRKFHAKIFVFETAALLGSSNLTDGGFLSNREAVICLDRPEDSDAVEDIRSLFLELWESGRVLTEDSLHQFRIAWESAKRSGPDPDSLIENAVGKAEPVTIDVDSWTKSPERLFIDELERRIDQYRSAFLEVTRLLQEHQFRRPALQDVGPEHETNRFLNWVRDPCDWRRILAGRSTSL
jgi:phosphatidylserine/phosphatidylglycerophosphate/cardiolipin synthase-like enzyme